MRIKGLIMAGLVAAIGLVGGCQDWKGKYEACNAEYENLQALFDSMQDDVRNCDNEKTRLNDQIRSLQQQLAQAQTVEPTGPGGLAAEGGKYDPQSGTITVTLANDVLFDSGKVTLKSQPKAKLGRISSIIRQEHPGKDVHVVGHTDTDPIRKSGWKDNWQLSTERALAVTRYLISQGIPAKQLMAGGRGEYHPISSTKAQNRRVEIVVATR